ncbi:MAG: DUF3576 domain-containing protein, partial [Alphaproteobacteria bacterium]|nr:DUF3576 domain-containing protein [Alphaproteobacteria bacterium]
MEPHIKGCRTRGLTALSMVCVTAFMLSACEGAGYEPGQPEAEARPWIWEDGEESKGVFGGGLTLFSTEEKKAGAEGGGGIGVNSFLWRASLDTISFMPVNSADPFGGVIITDWHASPETPGERFKLNVYILG